MNDKTPLGALSGAPAHVLVGSVARAVAALEKSAGFKNLRAQYMGILWLVCEAPGFPQGVYAGALHYDLATFGRHVDALVLDGLLNKVQAPHDNRIMELTPTDSGRKALEKVAAQFDEVHRAMAERSGGDGLEAMIGPMRAFLAASAGD